jgi:hypothetical protein
LLLFLQKKKILSFSINFLAAAIVVAARAFAFRTPSKERTMTRGIRMGVVLGGLVLGLAGCTDPYSPGQRAVGGGLLGAGAGAAVGSLVGGGPAAATGAVIGGGLGAVGGAASTPTRPPAYYEAPPPPPRYRPYGY